MICAAFIDYLHLSVVPVRASLSIVNRKYSITYRHSTSGHIVALRPKWDEFKETTVIPTEAQPSGGIRLQSKSTFHRKPDVSTSLDMTNTQQIIVIGII